MSKSSVFNIYDTFQNEGLLNGQPFESISSGRYPNISGYWFADPPSSSPIPSGSSSVLYPVNGVTVTSDGVQFGLKEAGPFGTPNGKIAGLASSVQIIYSYGGADPPAIYSTSYVEYLIGLKFRSYYPGTGAGSLAGAPMTFGLPGYSVALVNKTSNTVQASWSVLIRVQLREGKIWLDCSFSDPFLVYSRFANLSFDYTDQTFYIQTKTSNGYIYVYPIGLNLSSISTGSTAPPVSITPYNNGIRFGKIAGGSFGFENSKFVASQPQSVGNLSGQGSDLTPDVITRFNSMRLMSYNAYLGTQQGGWKLGAI